MNYYSTDLPEYLENYSIFKEFLDQEFEGLNSTEKGDKFADLVSYLTPRTELGAGIEKPEKQKGSYDEGIDIIGENADSSRILCIQAKYSIKREIKEIDAIISDFEIFQKNSEGKPQQMKLFHENQDDNDDSPRVEVNFQIVMFSQKKGLIDVYAKSQKSSVAFYNRLLQEKRIEIIDGEDILSILQAEYRRNYTIPGKIELTFEKPFIDFGNVYLGIVSSETIKRIYEENGNAIFFENIRDFLGETSGKKPMAGRQTVNQAIKQTVLERPNEMLARNNGVTFKAAKVNVVSDTKVLLETASVINGCQTTMSVVKYAQETCYITCKVVETSDAWDIAKSSNRQNAPDEIDLELARYLRLQITDRVAQAKRVRVTRDGHEVFRILEGIYQTEITYEEVKSLFIGLFSRTPRNIFDNNYTELRYKVLELFFKSEDQTKNLFSDLIDIQQAFASSLTLMGENLEKLPPMKNIDLNPKQHVSQIYQRIYLKPSYRAYIALLAASSVCKVDISERSNLHPEDEFENIKSFLSQTVELITKDKARFEKFCKYAFYTVQALVPPGLNRDEISRRMHQYMKDARFSNLIDRVYTFENI